LRTLVAFDGPSELAEAVVRFDVTILVATTNQSVKTVLDAKKSISDDRVPKVAYYIQDYEPLFYECQSHEWHVARDSYGADPDVIHFAKTQWLQDVVMNNHGVRVMKVDPSVDHSVFYPDLSRHIGGAHEKVTIAGMLRPSTPRRAPRRTARILTKIANELGATARCISFGCGESDLVAHGIMLPNVRNLGVLSRQGIGRLMRSVDLFLDLSDYQAFGRTAIEGMACGAIPVVPAHGGSYEFAIDNVNAFVVDTRQEEGIFRTVETFLEMSLVERDAMRLAAIERSFRYSPHRAALSELRVLLANE